MNADRVQNPVSVNKKNAFLAATKHPRKPLIIHP